MQPPSLYDKYNYTELQQICERAGLLVPINAPREDLIDYIEGNSEPPPMNEDDNVFHSWRNALISFVKNHWKKMATQLTCPAQILKNPAHADSRPCFGCIDAQVVTCLVQNPEAEQLIASYQLVRRPKVT